MDKPKYKTIEILSAKNKDDLNKNPLNLMNRTFSQPKIKLQENQKTKEKYTQKTYNRIKSSQNFFNRDIYLNYAKNPIRNNLYSSSTIILRAPSVKENRYEIYRMMLKEKNKKMNYINNMYNNLMINESKLYRKKLYLTGFISNNNHSTKGQIELKKKFSMNDMNIINDTKSNKNKYFCFRAKTPFLFNKNRYYSNFYDSSLIRYKNLKKNIEEDKNDDIVINYKYKNKNKKQSATLSTSKTNCRSMLKSAKQIENSKLNDINTKSVSISKETTVKTGDLFKQTNRKTKTKYFYLYKKENLINKSKDYFLNNNQDDNNKQNSFRIYNDVEMSNMALELNAMIFNPNIEIDKDLTKLEKLIMKFKTFKNFQKFRLEEVSKQDIKGLEKRIFMLQKYLKKYNKISFEYFREMQDYITFLNDTKIYLNNNSEGENNKRFNLYFELEKLVNENVIKQRELEHLVLIKHFLIQVKHCLIKQPSYFNIMLKEASHKYDLGKLILDLKIQPQNQNVIKFMESIPEIREEKINQNIIALSVKAISKTIVNKSTPKKRTKKYSQIYMLKSNNNNTNNINSERIDRAFIKYMEYPDKEIFKSPEEFIDLLTNLENRNLRLIRESNYLTKNINILKRRLESVSNDNINEEIKKDVKTKEDLFKTLKEQNISLQKKYNYLTNPKNRFFDNNNLRHNIKRTKKQIIDLNVLKRNTYNKIIENYNKKGLFFFEKLLTIIKNFFKLKYNEYEIDRGYDLIGKNELNKILKLTQKNLKNIDNIYLNKYILCLLKLYENICEFVKYKDVVYNSSEKYRELIHKKKEEIQLQRKMNNSKNVRQLAEEKRVAGIKNIMEKNNRINSLFKKKFDQNIVLKNKIRKNKSLADIFRYRKNFKEKEFNFYVNYDA